MPTIGQVWQCIQQGNYACPLDLKYAYLHIPIVAHHCCFLWFVMQHKPCQWKVLPLGLVTAHRVFTSLSKTHTLPLQMEGFLCYIFG